MTTIDEHSGLQRGSRREGFYRRLIGAIAGPLLLVAGTGAAALTVTVDDCREGAEFIGNAARARDNGVSQEDFLQRLDEDLILIKAFPPSLRWFAQDDEDAALLRESVVSVYENPRAAVDHALEFNSRCSTLAAEVHVLYRGRYD